MKINKTSFLLFIFACISVFAQNPELVVQNGHSSGALLMDVSFDGRYLITSGADINSLIGSEFSDLPYKYFEKTDEQNGLIIYDIYSGNILRYCQNSKGGINSIAASNVDYKFATGDYFGNITIFDLSGNVIYSLSKKSDNALPFCLVNDIKFFNGENKIAACYSDSSIVIWDLRGKEIKRKYKLPSAIKLIDLSSKNDFLIFACENGNTGMIDFDENNISILDSTEGEIVSLNISNDEKYLYVLKINDFQNEVQIWNVSDLKLEKKFIIDSPIFTRGKFTNNCKKLFASVWSGGLIEINCDNGTIENDNISEFKKFVYSIAITPDDKICIFSIPDAKSISFYDIGNKKIVKNISNDFNWVISVNFLPDSKSFISVAGKNLFWWDLAYCKIQNSINFDNEVYSASSSKDGTYSAVGTSAGDLYLIDNAKRTYYKYNFSQSAIYSVDFSDDNKKLAFASDKVYVIDIESNKLINSFQCSNSTIRALKFFSNTSSIVVGSFDRTARVYNYLSGNLVKVFKEIDGVVMSIDVKNDLISIYSAGKGIYIYNSNNFNLEKFIKYDNSLITCLKFIDDRIIASDWNGDIYLFSSENNSYEKIFINDATILKIDISNDKRFLIAGGSDGSVKIWDIINFKKLATFISVGVNDYLSIIPENYYTVSKNGYKAIAFRIGDKAYSFEQFDLIFNRPDLVYERIGILSKEEIEMYRKAYEKRLKKSGFIDLKPQNIKSIPQIKITNENITPICESDIFNLEFYAIDSNFSLKEISVSVNNVPYKKIVLDSEDKKLKQFRTKIPVELSSGRNKIEVYCVNEKAIESLKETIVIYSTKEIKPDLYIISVGVSNYLDNSRKLDYASKDAKDISELFSSDKFKNKFNNVNVITLLDSQVTKENILSLKKVLLNTKVNDVVIVFFAGHGLLDKNGNYYFGTYNINFEHPAMNGINFDEIESLFDGIKARIKLLFMDSCHSGDLDEDEYKSFSDLKNKSDTTGFNLVVQRSIRGDEITSENINKEKSKSVYEFMKEIFNDISRSTGTVVISAASGLSYALESPELKNGVFTYSIIKGIKYLEADLNKDKKIFVNELKEYIIENVKKLTHNGQKPTVRKENMDYDYQIW